MEAERASPAPGGHRYVMATELYAVRNPGDREIVGRQAQEHQTVTADRDVSRSS
jgi:hypothetical protein